MSRRRGADEEGYATVLAAGALAMVAVLLGLVLGLGAAVVTRHRAAVAADLAALAAAAEVVRGSDPACARARDLAARNGGELVACVVQGWDVEVVVTRECGCLPVADRAFVRARAGPVVKIMA